MKKLFLLILFAGMIFSTCKKEDCPPPVAPTPAPIQKKLMVYARNFFDPLEDLVYFNITNAAGDSWDGLTQTTYGNAPSCGSPGTLTIDVKIGEVYSVTAVCGLGDHTWGPTNYTITSDCTAIPIN